MALWYLRCWMWAEADDAPGAGVGTQNLFCSTRMNLAITGSFLRWARGFDKRDGGGGEPGVGAFGEFLQDLGGLGEIFSIQGTLDPKLGEGGVGLGCGGENVNDAIGVGGHFGFVHGLEGFLHGRGFSV